MCIRDSHDLERSQASGSAGGREHASPADHPTFLLRGVEQHEGGVGDADDRGECGGVRVVDHDCARLRIDPLPEPSGVAGQRQCSCRARFDHAASVQQLTASGAPEPACSDGSPLDDLPATDAEESEHDEDEDDRKGHDDRAQIEAQDQGPGGQARHHELRT